MTNHQHLVICGQIDDQLVAVGQRAAAEQRRIERDKRSIGRMLMALKRHPKRVRASRGFELAEQTRGR